MFGLARALLVAHCFALLLLPLSAAAQTDPTGAVRIILPVPAGGGLDALARALSDRLSENLKRGVVIESRPGAAGNIAAEYVARSAPDGTTLLLAFDSVATINPFVYPRTPFSPDAQLKPVALIGLWGLILVVNPSITAKSLQELAALSRNRPLRIASSGNGSVSHLAVVHLQRETGMEILHVPYKGATPAITDVVGGHVDGFFAISQLAIPLVRAGKIRAFGYSGRTRSPLAPELPTMSELGVRDFDLTGTYVVFVPTATPEAVVSQLYAALQDAIARPDVHERITQQDVVPVMMPAAEAASWIERTRGRWGQLIKEFRVTSE